MHDADPIKCCGNRLDIHWCYISSQTFWYYVCLRCGLVLGSSGTPALAIKRWKHYRSLDAENARLTDENAQLLDMIPDMDSEGYPSDLFIEQIEQWTHKQGWERLLERVRNAWHYDDGVHVKYEYHGGRRFAFLTRGWSGNEALIAALNENHIFRMTCWESSTRGGEHVFIIPVGLLNQGNEE